LLLRLFGASVGKGAKIMPSVRIWAPWNLSMGVYACLGEHVDCYCVAPVTIGAHATISQYTFLCGATHDERDPHMRLVARPIVVESQSWVCADVFVAPGVIIGEGCVVGARSSVFSSLPPWKVCYGTPAIVIRNRLLNSAAG
jgi:putative colanic acid biosynthesis acetyltransferase WcaF